MKHLFAFAEKIVIEDSWFLIGSLDVDSLFTNIQLEKTIDIYTNKLFENTERVKGLSKMAFLLSAKLLLL